MHSYIAKIKPYHWPIEFKAVALVSTLNDCDECEEFSGSKVVKWCLSVWIVALCGTLFIRSRSITDLGLVPIGFPRPKHIFRACNWKYKKPQSRVYFYLLNNAKSMSSYKQCVLSMYSIITNPNSGPWFFSLLRKIDHGAHFPWTNEERFRVLSLIWANFNAGHKLKYCGNRNEPLTNQFKSRVLGSLLGVLTHLKELVGV